MYLRTKKSGAHTYLQLVESVRAKKRVEQRVRHSFGRLDELRESGQLDSLTAAFAKFSTKLAVLGEHKDGQLKTDEGQSVGPAMVFERLWDRVGLRRIIDARLMGRNFEFPVERAVFLTVLHRLSESGSDKAAEKWMGTQAICGVEKLELHHLYRAMSWLGEVLPEKDARGEEHFATRSTKDLIEEDLFIARRSRLFADLSLVFFDTTSIYFEGEGGMTLGELGHTKDHRPDLHQMIVGVVLDDNGNPICSEMWPGNVSDVTTLISMAKRLKERFGVTDVCIVADRGMISKVTVKALADMKWRFILGARMRKNVAVRDQVLTRAGRYEEVFAKENEEGLSPLKIKEVWHEEERYIVCLNEDQATKDRHDREAIIRSLEDQLKKGCKSLIGNRGYRRYIKVQGKGFCIDREKLEEEARYDGKWVLHTNTDLPAAEVALKYKQLIAVEMVFRTMKSILDTRPIYHQLDRTIRGHVFCSFMALVLKKELMDILSEKSVELEWADIIRDLTELRQTKATSKDGKSFFIRNEARTAAVEVFNACGIALPPYVREIGKM